MERNALARSGDDPARVMMIQDGARLHYAVPLALQRAGLLKCVYTNWYARPWSLQRLISGMVGVAKPVLGRRMLDRYCADLPGDKVISFPSLTWHEQTGRKNFSSAEGHAADLSARFARKVLARGWRGANVVAGFIRNADPSLFRAAKEAGLWTVGDQMIAPYAVELQEELRQRERFGQWQKPRDAGRREGDETVLAVERASWKALDHVTCASGYVRDGLIAQGVEGKRITVLPYPLAMEDFPLCERKGRSEVTVGFVGAVGLRKGAPYFLEVAKRVKAARVKFVMVGPVQVEAGALAELKQHVEVAGAVPRSMVRKQLERFDVFFFPSTCEGSAGSVMEAMATGLPVVASVNSGTIVEEGVSGFVSRYDDSEKMAESIERLAQDDGLRARMGLAARRAVEGCSLDAYARGWSKMVREEMSGAGAARASNVMSNLEAGHE